MGSFVNREYAEDLVRQLVEKGYEATIRKVQVEEKEFYRVQTGIYPHREAAEEAARKLKEEGFSPVVSPR